MQAKRLGCLPHLAMCACHIGSSLHRILLTQPLTPHPALAMPVIERRTTGGHRVSLGLLMPQGQGMMATKVFLVYPGPAGGTEGASSYRSLRAPEFL